MSQVGYLLSVKAAANVLLLVVIVPAALKAWLRMYPEEESQANFYGFEISVLLSAVGTLCLGLATNLGFAIVGRSRAVIKSSQIWYFADGRIAIIIYGFGSATGIFLLSLVKSSVTPNEDRASGRDFSIVIMLRTVGELVGIPLMTASWLKGVSNGGAALGFPYFLSSVSLTPVIYGQDSNCQPVFYLLVLGATCSLQRVSNKSKAQI